MIAGLLAALARLVAGSSVRWLHPPSEDGQRVFIANHTSHLDFIVLWSHLPPPIRKQTRPVAARDYWSRDPIRRFLAERVFLALLIDRMPASGEEAAAAGKRAVAQMLDALSSRASLILFPEGTRGKGDALGTFRSGIFHLCREKPGLEVVPVRIENLNRILPKGEFLPVPMLSRISFGVPFRLEDGETKDAFLTRARKKIEELSAA